MKQFLLASTVFLVATGSGWAACTPTVVGNLNVFDCASNNQPADGDELKSFISAVGSPVGSITSSLNKNTSAPGDQNIDIAANAGATFSQQGNGFAELKSGLAGQTDNNLQVVTFTPILPSVIDGQTATYNGFDGFFTRGQVDAIGSGSKPQWDGMVTMLVNFVGGGSQSLTFNAGKGSQDIGTIGFDGAGSTEKLVSSVVMSLDETGAFNEVKQMTYSVPGAVSSIPEPSTWAMMIAGFIALGFVAFRKRPSVRAAL
jgi:hypothetical protein